MQSSRARCWYGSGLRIARYRLFDGRPANDADGFQ
jgi:hypothetical protein